MSGVQRSPASHAAQRSIPHRAPSAHHARSRRPKTLCSTLFKYRSSRNYQLGSFYGARIVPGVIQGLLISTLFLVREGAGRAGGQPAPALRRALRTRSPPALRTNPTAPPPPPPPPPSTLWPAEPGAP